MPVLREETSVFPEQLLEGAEEEGLLRHWWAVYTRARQEKALARELLQYQIPFYLPLVAKRLMYRGRKIQSHVPLFTGYLFLYGTEDERVQSLTTNRISQLLPVTDEEQLFRDLKQVRTLIEAKAPLTVESRLMPGRRVRIRYGSLMGLEGTIERRAGGCRLTVAVNFLQQGVSLEVDECVVEPLD